MSEKNRPEDDYDCECNEAEGDTQKFRMSNFSPTGSVQSTSDQEILSKPFSIQRPPSFLSLAKANYSSFIEETCFDASQNEKDQISGNIETEPDLSSQDDSFQILTDESSCFRQPNILLKSTTDPDAEGTGRCIECVKAIPVFSAEQIENGDHITFAGAIYDHHAIVVKKRSDKLFEVIEATNTFSGVVVSFSKFLGQKAKLVSSTKTFDFKKQKIHVIFYRKRRYSKSETVKRAKRCLKGGDVDNQSIADYKYHLFENNCEHFATYCVTGEEFSIQVTKFRLTSKLFWTSGFIGISDEKKRTEKEHENNIICDECYEINMKLLDAPIRKITKKEDIQKGDVIRYSYWNLWHEAVVLEISEVKNDYVTCFIAHYAFCGFFSHRTIKRELIFIYLNGSYSKIEYKSPAFNVYDPETVVCRAESRLDEQMFVFFSNDSSHFARWCKLKLEQ